MIRRNSHTTQQVSAAKAAALQSPLPHVHTVTIGQEGLFPPVAMLLRTTTLAERAALLLTISDGVIVSHQVPLLDACFHLGFAHGADFIQVRAATLFSRRDLDGHLPHAIAEQLAFWCAYMASLAKGAPCTK